MCAYNTNDVFSQLLSATKYVLSTNFIVLCNTNDNQKEAVGIREKGLQTSKIVCHGNLENTNDLLYCLVHICDCVMINSFL